MKRWGIVSLMLFAFVVGFASTYSCGGGGGSSSSAADYAPLVHEHSAADITSGVLDLSLIPSHTHPDYAFSDHSHSEYMGAMECSPGEVLKWNGDSWICASDLDSTDAETLDGLDSSDFVLSSDFKEYMASLYPGVLIVPTPFNTDTPFSEVSSDRAYYYPVPLNFSCNITAIQAYVRDYATNGNIVVNFNGYQIGTEWVATPGYTIITSSENSTPYIPGTSDPYVVVYGYGSISEIHWVKIFYSLP